MNKFTQALFDLAERAGKWGIPGVLLICLRSVIEVARHPSWDAIESGLSTVGVGLILVGVLANTNKLKHLTVTAAAEGAIGRAAVMDAVTPLNVMVTPVSSEPAINREIVKQLRESNGGMKANGGKDAGPVR